MGEAVELRIIPHVPQDEHTRGGKAVAVIHDKIVVSDGEHEIDLSPLVGQWDVLNKAGGARMVVVTLYVTDMGNVIARHPAKVEHAEAAAEVHA